MTRDGTGFARRFGTPLGAAAALCTLIFAARQTYLAVAGPLNIDEFENIQIVWLALHGIWPFVDYLHSHLPAFNVFIAPLYALVGPTPVLPGVVRIALFPAVIATVWGVWALARDLRGTVAAAWIATALFAASSATAATLSEMRGDTLAYPLLIWAWVWLNRCVRDGWQWRRFVVAGVLTGVSLLMSQKGIFLALCLSWFVERSLCAGTHVETRGRWTRRLVFTGLAYGPAALFTLMLWTAGWLGGDGARVLLSSSLFVANPQGVLFAVSRDILASALKGNLIFLLAALVFLARSVAGKETTGGVISVAALFLAVSFVQFAVQRILYYQVFVLPLAAVAILAGNALDSVRIRRGAPAMALGLLICFWTYPWMLDGPSRSAQLDDLRAAMSLAPRDGPFLDTLTGMGTFRPVVGRSLYYRPILYDSGFLERGTTREVLEGLRSGRYVGVGIDDRHLRSLPPAVRDALSARYRAFPGHPRLWVRNDADDEAHP